MELWMSSFLFFALPFDCFFQRKKAI